MSTSGDMADVAVRIMHIAKDNTLAAIILTGILPDRVDRAQLLIPARIQFLT